MHVLILLDEIQQQAQKEPEFKKELLTTRQHAEPLSEFCRICREHGYKLYEMDLVGAGEEFYAAIRRSTNGGGENSPALAGEDDLYEAFFIALESA